MIISLFGYGKMGKEIEQIAVQRGHQIGLKINSSNSSDITKENIKNTDVIIEFSRPEFAKDNILFAIENNVPIVVGTTGWYEDYDFLKSQALGKSGTLLTATNFSVGVNIFFKINEYLAKIMNTQDAYDFYMKEIYNTKINEIKKVLKLQARKVKDDATKIKLLEVVKLLKEIDKGSRISNDDLINLLQYYQLTEELALVK